MHEESTHEELLASLERIAERFPGQPVWRSLAEKAKDAVADLSGTRAGDGWQADGEGLQQCACWCCDRRPPGSKQGLCDLCRQLYEPRSARVVADACDCGHAPQGPEVYIYTPSRPGHVLCGEDCVKAHWRRLFSFLLRRSS